MANTKISALTSLSAVPASTDLFVVVDVSDTTQAASGTSKKIEASYLAFQGQANTFTVGQNVQPAATNNTGVTINMPSGATAVALLAQLNGTNTAYMQTTAAERRLHFENFDNGSSYGPLVRIGANNNGSTPASGWLAIVNRGIVSHAIWPDASGNLRIMTGANPTSANDTGGVVIGSQSSHVDYKNIVGDPVDGETALGLLRSAAAEVQRFIYKNGSFNNQEFSGLILDGGMLHRYGMDADEAHPAGKSLNVVNLLGDLLLAVDYLAGVLES